MYWPRITAVFENSSNDVTVPDFDGNILSWNRTAERRFGWTEQEATHRHITEITAEKHRHDFASVVSRLQRGETVTPFEIVRIPKAGEPITVCLHATTLVDQKQQPVKFATFGRLSVIQ